MAKHPIVGIDIGSSKVKTVIAEEVSTAKEGPIRRIIGAGVSETRGMQRGYIANSGEVSQSIRESVRQAAAAARTNVKRAFVSVGGVGLESVVSTGSVVVSRADLEITSREMGEALEIAEEAIPQSALINKRIINTIPVEWKVDGKPVWGRVEGLRGHKLEVKALFITCLEHHLDDLIRTVEGAGIEVIDVVAAPIASSFVTLSKKQKKAGCLLANFGAETLSLIVFEEGKPVSLEVFPIGSTDITNDIALGLKLPLEEAESIKMGSITRSSYSKRRLEEVVSARLSDCFELIEAHLKKIGRNALLPAGIIITGGGAGLVGIKDLAESSLKLPASLATIHFGDEEKSSSKDMAWSTAYGLAVVGFNAEDGERVLGTRSADLIKEKGRRGLLAISDWISKFLP